MSANDRTIVLKGKAKGHHDEGVCDGTPVPGMCIEMKANGHWDVLASSKAESLKANSLRIVKEDDYQGKTITQAYAANDNIFFYTPLAGDHINLRVKAGENIAVGDKLVEEGAASGLFVEAAGTETRYRARALESTGGALGADGHVKCEWL